jgi:hypothetical protein
VTEFLLNGNSKKDIGSSAFLCSVVCIWNEEGAANPIFQ